MQKLIDRRQIGWIACVEMSVYDVPGLGAYEKLVYTILCGFANKDGVAFPTIQTLAMKASCSDRKVQQVLRSLEECGLIAQTERFIGNQQKSNLYEIHSPAICEPAENEPKNVEKEDVAEDEKRTTFTGCTTFTPGGVNDIHPGGEPHSPRTIPINKTNINNILPVDEPGSPVPSEQEKQKTPLEDWFKKFYEHYPRPVDKKKAHKAFMAIFSKTPHSKHRTIMENLIFRLTVYVAERKAAIAKDPEANQYTKYPASWLNAHDFTEPPREDEMLMEERWE